MQRNDSLEEDEVSGDAGTSHLTRRIFLPVLTAAIATSGVAVAKPAAQGKPSAPNSETGTVWWTELRTRDLAATRDFYAGVIGWTPKLVAQDDMSRPPAVGEAGYTVFTMRGQEIAGAEKIEAGDPAGQRPGWFTYIQVEDVDEAAAKATKHGGKIVQQPSDVAGVGRVAEIEDPEGNRIGLVAPRT